MVCIIILFYVVVKPDSVERLSQQAATGPSQEYLRAQENGSQVGPSRQP